MRENEFKYRQFDLIKIKKLHANEIFSQLKKGNYFLDLSDTKFIKERPAIILRVIKKSYIVIPLTTKPLGGNENSNLHKLLRCEFSLKGLQKSYLMFDSVLKLDSKQIDGLYKNNNKRIVMSNSNKKYLLSNAKNKYEVIFSNYNIIKKRAN